MQNDDDRSLPSVVIVYREQKITHTSSNDDRLINARRHL